MKYFLWLSLCFLGACQSNMPEENPKITAFNTLAWTTKVGDDYPLRADLLPFVLASDSLRRLPEALLLQALGAPDRRQNVFLYYKIAQKRIGLWPLHTTTLVVELGKDSLTAHRFLVHK